MSLDRPHLLIVEARFYEDIADKLCQGAIAKIEEAGGTYERLEVPGAFEIPGAIALAADSEEFDGFLALGCVIRGETTHYDYVCGETARALMDLSVQEGIAIGFGLLTVENRDQAEVRADPQGKDHGGKAAVAALRMIELVDRFEIDT
jgi:6,7-dimethyl-8-ribityllumazine synthase